MAAAVVTMTTQVPEGSSFLYKAVLRDENGVAIPAADLLTLKLTLVDTATRAIINSVNQTNILNTGRGTADAQGNLTVSLLAADTMLSSGVAWAQRSLVLDWTYSPNRVGRHEVIFPILALAAP